MAKSMEMPFVACTIDEVEEYLSPLPQLILVGHAPNREVNEQYTKFMQERLRPAAIPFPRVSVGGATEETSPDDCYAYGNYMAQMILDVPGMFFGWFGVVDPPAGVMYVDVQ